MSVVTISSVKATRLDNRGGHMKLVFPSASLNASSIYYKANSDVSSASKDGTLTPGQSVTLSAVTWVICSAAADGSTGFAALSLDEAADDPAASSALSGQSGGLATYDDSRFPATPIPYSSLTRPILVSHRGSSNVFPEESLAAYEACMDQPILNTLEGDVQALADGTLVLIHDTTLDRTTPASGNVVGLTLPGWRTLTVDEQDPTVTAYPSAIPPTVEEVFRRYGRRAYYNLGTKNGTTSDASLLALVRQYGVDKYVLFGPSSQAQYNNWKNTGVPLFWSIPAGDNANFVQYVSDGVFMVGIPSADSTYISQIHAAGMTVGTNLDSRATAAPWMAAGADAITSGDSMWMSGLNPVALTDPYALKRYWYGHYASGSSNRGKFLTGNRWGIDDASATWVLQGWGSPVAKSTSAPWSYATGTFPTQTATYPWSITFTITLDRAGVNSEAGIAFGATDDGTHWNFGGKSGGTGSGAAYYGTINEDGTINLYKRVNGTVTLLQTAATTALTAGSTATLKAEMTSGTVLKLTRTDGTPTTVTVTDSSLRGGYFWFGHNIDSGWSWSAVTVA